MNRALMVGSALTATAWCLGAPGAHAAEAGAFACYLAGDRDAREDASEAGDFLSRAVLDAQGGLVSETVVGTSTGTRDLESLTVQPGTGTLFGVDAGQLGTVDPETGRFTPRASTIGTVSAEDHGLVRAVQGLAFDPSTGWLYVVERTGGDDLLLRADPVTGARVTGGLGGADAVPVRGVSGLDDVDDLVIDPAGHQLYAIVNHDGTGDHLARIDKLTGTATDVGPLGGQARDIEGLSFLPDGTLVGMSGGIGGQQSLWTIDRTTGAASRPRSLSVLSDYEGAACRLLPASAPSAAPATTTTSSTTTSSTTTTTALSRRPDVAPAPLTAPLAQPELPKTGPGPWPQLAGAGLLFTVGGQAVASAVSRSRRRARR